MRSLVAAGTGALAGLLIAGRKGAPAAPGPHSVPRGYLATPSGGDRHGEAAIARIAQPNRRAGGDNLDDDDPYAILGVTRSASAREIRAAYVQLVKELHPDGRVPDSDDPEARDADDHLKRINEAYQELKSFSGRVKPQKAARQQRSKLRAGGLFLVGVLTSVAPMLAILLFAFYYAGWFEPHDTRSKVATVPKSTHAPAPAPPSDQSVTRAVEQRAALLDARQRATKAAWQAFLEAYPNASDAAEAREAIASIERAEARKAAAEAAWIAARRAGTKAELQHFAETHPESEHVAQARLAIAAVEQAEAKTRSEQAAREQATGEHAAWAAVEKGGRAELLAYIEAHPDGVRVGRARQALAAIEQADARRREEHAAWVVVERSGDRSQLLGFLDAYPDGVHAGEARAGIARIAAESAAIEAELAAWAEADRIGGKTALREYLAEFPAGSYAAEARERIARLEAVEDDRDDAAWSHARQRNSKAAYAGYLTSYPAGRSAREARARLAELERAPAPPPPVEPAKAPAILPRVPIGRSSVPAGELGPGKSTQRHNDGTIRSIGVITLY